MAANKQTGPKKQQIIDGFNKLRAQQAMIGRQIVDLEMSQQEHRRVIKTLKGAEGSRKCFRMIGSILVERTVSDILPALEADEAKMPEKIKELKEKLEAVGHELVSYKKEHNIRFSNEPPLANEGAPLEDSVKSMAVK